MLRITTEDEREAPAPIPFPRARRATPRTRLPGPTDSFSCDAARQVESALEQAQERLDRVKDAFRFPTPDDDRPRAA